MWHKYVMESQSGPPDSDILAEDSISNAPATGPGSLAATSAAVSVANSQDCNDNSVATSKKRKLTSTVLDHFEKIIEGERSVLYSSLKD